MGDTGAAFEPVGQYYNAVSPDESVTSARELTDCRFKALFDVREVFTLKDLLGDDFVESLVHLAPDGWAERVGEALLDTKSNEHHMNAILQSALKEIDGVEGLPVGIQNSNSKNASFSAVTGGKNQQNNQKAGEVKKESAQASLETEDQDEDEKQRPEEMENAPKLTVRERYIRNLFVDSYNDECYKGLDRVNGLPITLQSQPNFAMWAVGGGGMLITCEGKDERKYVLHNAVRQCAAYMLVHMYYWLVTTGKAVESVYGVAVAGAKCRDMQPNRFAVVLMRVSLPTKIGGKLRVDKYVIGESLEQLWKFTAFLCPRKPSESVDLRVGKSRPACLQMPLALLEENPNGWQMVPNGTANLVLLIEEERGWNALGPYLQDRALDRLNYRRRCAPRGGGRYPFYFKSKNYLATTDPQNSAFYENTYDMTSEALIDIRDAYSMPPFQTASGVYILMSPMGILFHRASFKGGLRAFAKEFVVFMDRVLECQEVSGIVHGDIHLGNLLLDQKQRLRLIDYDEARVGDLTVRNAQTERQQLVYNERLAKDYVLYTKGQLIQLFWECWHNLKEESSADLRITLLYGNYHAKCSEGGSPDAEDVETCYERLREVLPQLSDSREVLADSQPKENPTKVQNTKARNAEKRKKKRDKKPKATDSWSHIID